MGAPQIIFENPDIEPLHEGGFEGMELSERAGIETAEQAVRAVMRAQARGCGLLPHAERADVAKGCSRPSNHPVTSRSQPRGGGGSSGSSGNIDDGGNYGGGGGDRMAVAGNPFLAHDRDHRRSAAAPADRHSSYRHKHADGGEAPFALAPHAAHTQCAQKADATLEGPSPRQSFAMWAEQERRQASAALDSRRTPSDARREARRDRDRDEREARAQQSQARLQAEREYEAAQLREYEAQRARKLASQEEQRRSTASNARDSAEARARAGEARRQAELVAQQEAEERLTAPMKSRAAQAPSLYNTFSRWFGSQAELE